MNNKTISLGLTSFLFIMMIGNVVAVSSYSDTVTLQAVEFKTFLFENLTAGEKISIKAESLTEGEKFNVYIGIYQEGIVAGFGFGLWALYSETGLTEINKVYTTEEDGDFLVVITNDALIGGSMDIKYTINLPNSTIDSFPLFIMGLIGVFAIIPIIMKSRKRSE